MTAIGHFIRERREDAELTQAQLAEKVRVDQGTVSKWENGHRAPNFAERKRLAAAFSMQPDEFEEQWRKWSIARTQGVPGKIPVINRAPAGIAIDYEEYGVDSGQGHQYIDAVGIDDDLAFAVEVVGDSMEPALHEGDLVILSPLTVPQPKVKAVNGSIVFVRFTEESPQNGCTLARLRRLDDGRIELTKDNGAYQSVVVGTEEISQISVAVQRRTTKL